MGGDSNTARLDELWEAHVFKLAREVGWPTDGDRSALACRLLNSLRDANEQARLEGNREAIFNSAVHGRMVWQLLTLASADWLLHGLAGESRLTEGARSSLRYVLEVQRLAEDPTHIAALDQIALLLPRGIAAGLIDGLAALDRGEVLPLLEPRQTGRHDRPWSWDSMRTTALQHVLFLRGQGSNLQIARRRVAQHMGVSPETLRDWSSSLSPTEPIDLAFQAGKLKTMLDDNPRFAIDDGNSLDAYASALLARLSSQSLSEFGALYRERFGGRHNQPTEGD